eukprot:TRINITY_DN5809_c0_g2_i1.p1 TRINITY_DN5809_c0_g2~~TRINITY_DN5809_c0_g2_i1.p1  ORF type:complete len:227 (+),score=41.81 TRINITY_DN5809_c0_g2_i1:988-1668(+)
MTQRERLAAKQRGNEGERSITLFLSAILFGRYHEVGHSCVIDRSCPMSVQHSVEGDDVVMDECVALARLFERKQDLERRVAFLFMRTYKNEHSRQALFSLVGVSKQDTRVVDRGESGGGVVDINQVHLLKGGLMLDYVFEFVLRSFGVRWEHFYDNFSPSDQDSTTLLYPFAGLEMPTCIIEAEMELLHVMSEAKKLQLVASIVNAFETCMVSVRAKLFREASLER